MYNYIPWRAPNREWIELNSWTLSESLLIVHRFDPKYPALGSPCFVFLFNPLDLNNIESLDQFIDFLHKKRINLEILPLNKYIWKVWNEYCEGPGVKPLPEELKSDFKGLDSTTIRGDLSLVLMSIEKHAIQLQRAIKAGAIQVFDDNYIKPEVILPWAKQKRLPIAKELHYLGAVPDKTKESVLNTSLEAHPSQPKPSLRPYEEFIGQICMQMKDDQVLIKFPNNRTSQSYNRVDLGFGKHSMDYSWNIFEDILKFGHVKLPVIPAIGNKSDVNRKLYDKMRNSLKTISKKLIAFFNKKSPSINIPESVFLFKALDGEYRPLFMVKDMLLELVRAQKRDLENDQEALPFGHSPYEEKTDIRWDKGEDQD